MGFNVIPSNEADLLLHRFITERIPITAYFVSADESVHFNLDGFVSGFTRESGLNIVSDLVKVGNIPAFMMFTNVSGAVCRYADETQHPKSSLLSALRLELPNGHILTIAERRAS